MTVKRKDVTLFADLQIDTEVMFWGGPLKQGCWPCAVCYSPALSILATALLPL